MEIDFPLNEKLPVLSLNCAFELAMSRIILEHVDHVVEINEGVIDGDNIHFARVKNSPGDQAPNTTKSIHSPLCLRAAAGTEQEGMAVKVDEQRA